MIRSLTFTHESPAVTDRRANAAMRALGVTKRQVVCASSACAGRYVQTVLLEVPASVAATIDRDYDALVGAGEGGDA